MNDLLGFFDQFVKERVYLKAVTPKTRIWYQTAFKAFQSTPGDDFLNTYLKH